MCNRLFVRTNEPHSDYEYIYAPAGTTVYLNISKLQIGYLSTDTNAQAVTKLKTYLASNNTELYYQPATPTSISLAIPEILLSDDTIITTTNVIKPNLTVEYLLKNYITDTLNTLNQNNIITGVEFATNDWIDYKQVFGKRINCGALLNNGEKIVATGLNNVMYIKLEGVAIGGTISFPINNIRPIDGISSCIGAYMNGNNIAIQTGVDRTGYTAWITVYYTKN